LPPAVEMTFSAVQEIKRMEEPHSTLFMVDGGGGGGGKNGIARGGRVQKGRPDADRGCVELLERKKSVFTRKGRG